MTKKKNPPSHIKFRKFSHPGKDHVLIHSLEDLKEPRGPSCNFQYSLTSILFMTIVTSICGADDWPQIVVLSNSMCEWMSQFVDMSAGVPSEYTFKRVFSLLAPKEINRLLIVVSEAVTTGSGEDIVNFDGKTLRGTRDEASGLRAIHILNAWSTERGICIGQLEVGKKTNEITAMPKLMEMLDLRGTIVTSDALNTQKEIVKKAIEAGADYVLPVKGNHPGLQEEIETIFDAAIKKDFKGVDADQYTTLEKNRGRVEERTYYSLSNEELPSKDDWAGLESLGKVTRRRTVKGKETEEVHYYISSCDIDAKLLERTTRKHWQVENKLHWVLDVVFHEDYSRYRDENGAKNLAGVRKLALNALAKDRVLKASKAAKRLAAAADPAYRLEVLKNLF